MKRIVVIILVLGTIIVGLIAQPSESEAWQRRSAFFVAAGPSFYGFPISFGYTAFSRRSAFSISFSGYWPGYYYPYYAAPAYYPAPVYYEPVYYGKRYYGRYYDSRDDGRYERPYYRSRYDDRDWVKDAEEFLRGGR